MFFKCLCKRIEDFSAYIIGQRFGNKTNFGGVNNQEVMDSNMLIRAGGGDVVEIRYRLDSQSQGRKLPSINMHVL